MSQKVQIEKEINDKEEAANQWRVNMRDNVFVTGKISAYTFLHEQMKKS